MVVQVDKRVGAGPRRANGLVDALRVAGHCLRSDHARVAKVDGKLEEGRVAANEQVRLRHQVDVSHRLMATNDGVVIAQVQDRICGRRAHGGRQQAGEEPEARVRCGRMCVCVDGWVVSAGGLHLAARP